MPLQLHAPGFSPPRLLASITRILEANTLCSLATRSAAGTVHISTAFFSYDPELILYFLSNPHALHCRNLTRVPEMAITVFDSHQRWGELHSGLQLFGSGSRVAVGALEQARACYAARFTRYFDLVMRTREAPAPAAEPGGLRLYYFSPTRVKLLDEVEFGEDVYLTVEFDRRAGPVRATLGAGSKVAP